MLTDDKIIEIYCIADDFCKELSQEIKKLKKLPEDDKKRRNRSCEMSVSKIMTVLLLVKKNKLIYVQSKIVYKKIDYK